MFLRKLHTSLTEDFIAALLCYFLGVFGIHRFYRGEVGWGLVYLVTLGLFGFGWFIDTIVLSWRVVIKILNKIDRL